MSYDDELKSNNYSTPKRCAKALRKYLKNTNSYILDIGCGTGLSGQEILNIGFNNVDGSDFSEKMLYWPKGPRETDGVWASYWYKNAMNSKSFKIFKKLDEKIPRKYNNLLEECLPYYEYLYSFKK